jgi:P27 family predicted phage terminase small subunit
VKPPAHLSRLSKALWRRLVADYGLADEAHALEVLRLACEALDRADEARRILAVEGVTFLDRFGKPRPHPAAAIERDSAIRAARMFRELSLDADAPGEARVPRVGGGRS